MDCSSSSRVPVEYHDPFSIFSFVAPHLEKLLPLRNLHWTSPSRATRTIDSLYLHFQPASDIIRPAQPVLPAGLTLAQAAESATSTDAVEVAAKSPSEAAATIRDLYIPSSGPRFGVRERRHQIPGLRQSPQLKVLLLRCDDPESYKLSLRKYVREWIRTNSATSRSSTSSANGTSSHETHEAFEWAVIHVVFPDSMAATQPRLSHNPSSSSNPSTEKQSTSSLWSGRGSSTLFEKLRQDFNTNAKSAPDRICQVRLQKHDLPSDFPPVPNPAGPSVIERDQEILNAWSDVASKFKALIISSFDRRASQYTIDIKERNDQKSIPGWNFCTYFILKESLARGYESIGLIEDALVEYGELSLGLNWATGGAESPSALIPGVNLLAYTEEFNTHYLKSIEQLTAGDSTTSDSASYDHIFTPYVERPIFADRKHYRQMILSNNISLFDFRIYVFARHATLMLRLSEPDRPIPASTLPYSADDPAGEVADLTILAELCKQTVLFLSGIGALLREDIKQGFKKDGEDDQVNEDVVENLVASWCYSAADQMLQRTSCVSLPFSARKIGGWPEYLSASAELAATSRPPRTSSLITGDPSATIIPLGLRSGLEEYSAARGELIMFQRRIVANLANRMDWIVGLRSRSGLGEFQEVDLDGPPNSKALREHVSAGLYNPAMLEAMSSFEQYRDVYKRMSVYALKHFQTANRDLTADQLVADLAVIAFDEGDYSSAIQYFSKAHASFGATKWSLIESTLLQLHAECAKRLNRKDDYVTTILKLLAKAIFSKTNQLGGIPPLYPFWADQDMVSVSGLLGEVVNFARSELLYEIQVPLSNYFHSIEINREIYHFENRDGFSLKLNLTHLLPDNITFDTGTMRLKGLGTQDGHNFSLDLNGPATIEPGTGHIMLESFTSASGIFVVQSVTLKSGNITFVYNPWDKDDNPLQNDSFNSAVIARLDDTRLSESLRIHCYPHVQSFDVDLLSPKSVRVEYKKDLEFKLMAGWNDIISGEIKVKSRTAGLRLYTADCVCIDDGVTVHQTHTAGEILFGSMGPQTITTLSLPFTLEGESDAIVVQFSITYKTKDGDFNHYLLGKVPIGIALDVNVHDCFKFNAMLPHFTVRSTTGVPLCITRMDLQGLDSYDVMGPIASVFPMMVYSGGTAAMQYKIVRKDKPMRRSSVMTPSGQLALSCPMRLSVEFYQLNEEIIYLAQTLFEESLEKDEKMAPYQRLIVPIFKTQLKARLESEMDSISRVAMRHQFLLGSYESWDWPLAFQSLPDNMRGRILAWLVDWYEEHEPFSVNIGRTREDLKAIVRKLDINVPIPAIPVTCAIRLKILPDSDLLKTINHSSSSSEPVVAVGVPVYAKLSISWTSCWDFSAPSFDTLSIKSPIESAGTATHLIPTSPPPRGRSALSVDNTIGSVTTAQLASSSRTTKTFAYLFDAAPDAWVVGGARRRQFTLAEGETATFDISFIPLRVGQLIVPSVDVSELIEQQQQPGGDGGTYIDTARLSTSSASTLSAPSRRSRRTSSPSPSLPNPTQVAGAAAGDPSNGDSLTEPPAVIPPTSVRVEIDDPGRGRMVTCVANIVASTVAVGRSSEQDAATAFSEQHNHQNQHQTLLQSQHYLQQAQSSSTVMIPGHHRASMMANPKSNNITAAAAAAAAVAGAPPGFASAIPGPPRWSVGTGMGSEISGHGSAGFAGGVLLIETESRRDEKEEESVKDGGNDE